MPGAMVRAMSGQGFTLFETAIGACAIVWAARGIVGVQLPEANAEATRRRVNRRFPHAREMQPPPEVQHAVDGIVALLAGEKCDLTDISIDDSRLPVFNKRVYAIVRKIPPGATMTYGEIAERLGDKALQHIGVTSLGHGHDLRFYMNQQAGQMRIEPAGEFLGAVEPELVLARSGQVNDDILDHNQSIRWRVAVVH